MQTFLPYPNFALTAKCLDYKRLGKQRSETIQILNSLLYSSSGWRHHPVMDMWRGYEALLCQYGLVITKEWIDRGYIDNCYPVIMDIYNNIPLYKRINILIPRWLGNYEFHLAHRSNLLRKNYLFYSKYQWNEPSNLPYIWPKGDIHV